MLVVLNKIKNIYLLAVFFSLHLVAALPAKFSISKVASFRQKVNTLKVIAKTELFNNQNPRNNIRFNEIFYLDNFVRFFVSINIDDKNANDYQLSKLIKINIGDEQYFIENDYLTLKIKNPISPIMYINYSKSTDEIMKIIKKSKIDMDIIGLGRLKNNICRIYGAKEHNTFRKNAPPLLLQDKVGLLEDESFYKNITPQIWINKDSFFVNRFITKDEINNELITNDIHLSSYRVFDNTLMFPESIDIFHNDRLFARTTIIDIKINPKIDKALFNLSGKYKKRTYKKMLDEFSSEAEKILNFIHLYR